MQTSYQHIAEGLSFLFRCCLVNLCYDYHPKSGFQKYGKSFSSRTFLSSCSPSLDDVKKPNSKFAWERTKCYYGVMEEKWIILQTGELPRQLKNPSLPSVFTKFGLERDGNYFKSNEKCTTRNVLSVWFSGGNHSLEWPCTSSKDSKAFQLNCE